MLIHTKPKPRCSLLAKDEVAVMGSSLVPKCSNGECLVSTPLFMHTQAFLLALFPGLPRFFCSSVCVDNNTRIRVLLSMQTEEQKKNGLGLGTRLHFCYIYHNNTEKYSVKYMNAAYCYVMQSHGFQVICDDDTLLLSKVV